MSNTYIPNDEDLGAFIGWMRKGIKGDWNIACSGETRSFVWELLEKIKPKRQWSTSICLKNGETPFCSIRMVNRREQ